MASAFDDDICSAENGGTLTPLLTNGANPEIPGVVGEATQCVGNQEGNSKTLKKVRRKRSSKSKEKPEDQGSPERNSNLSTDNIKYRLRTPKKTPKKSTLVIDPADPAYKDERKSLKEFLTCNLPGGKQRDNSASPKKFLSPLNLNKPTEKVDNGTIDKSVQEKSKTDVSPRGFITASKGELRQSVNSNQEMQVNPNTNKCSVNTTILASTQTVNSVNAREKTIKDPLDKRSRETEAATTASIDMAWQQPNSDESELQMEIDMLQIKIKHVEAGSMEKMFLELRLDMKRDSMKMMKKIDNVAKVANTLVSDVSGMKEDISDLDSKVKTIQEAGISYETDIKESLSKAQGNDDQMRVLHGIVQKQAQVQYINKSQQEFWSTTCHAR